MEARVVQCERSLVGERLSQVDLALRELVGGGVGEEQDTDRPVLAVERHGQDGAVRARVHAVPEIVVVDDVGIAQDLV